MKSCLICAFGAILIAFDQPSRLTQRLEVCELEGFHEMLFFTKGPGRNQRANGITLKLGANVLETEQREQPICRSHIFNSVTDGPLVRA